MSETVSPGVGFSAAFSYGYERRTPFTIGFDIPDVTDRSIIVKVTHNNRHRFKPCKLR